MRIPIRIRRLTPSCWIRCNLGRQKIDIARFNFLAHDVKVKGVTPGVLLLQRLFIISTLLAVNLFTTSCFIERKIRPSDQTIIPVGYVINFKGVIIYRDATEPTKYWVKAIPGSFNNLQGKPGAVRVATYTITNDQMQQIRHSSNSSETINGHYIDVLNSRPDGGMSDTAITIIKNTGYLLLFVFDEVGGVKPVPVSLSVPNPSAIIAAISDVGVGAFEGLFPQPPRFIWTSSAELKDIPGNWVGLNSVRNRADVTWDPPSLTIPSNTTDTSALAGAIYYARFPERLDLRTKVIESITSLIELGIPPPGTPMYSISTNISGYPAAADLVGYQTPAFFNYLDALLEFKAALSNGDEQTLLGTWKKYPTYLVGSQALVALATIYGYRGDKRAFGELVREWKELISGTKPNVTGIVYAKQWLPDQTKPRIINPDGATVQCKDANGDLIAVDVGGILTGGLNTEQPCDAPQFSLSGWKMLEQHVVFLRLAERQGFSLLDFDNRALLRAYNRLVSRAPLDLPTMGRILAVTRYFDIKYGSRTSCQYQGLSSGYFYGAGTGTSLGWWAILGRLSIPCE